MDKGGSDAALFGWILFLEGVFLELDFIDHK